MVTETIHQESDSPYAAPLAAVGVPGVFRARIWYRWLITSVIGGIAALSLGIGLFLTLWVKQDAVITTMIGLGLLVLTALSVVPIVARRGPVLRVCRKGLIIRRFGRSEVVDLPSAPGYWRLVLALISGGTCRFPMLRIPWSEMSGVSIMTHQWESILLVQWRPGGRDKLYWVMLRQSEIAALVEQVAADLRAWADNADARVTLPTWGDPE